MWQYEFGSPSRYKYHNKEWTLKMMDIGLMPTTTGKPGGKPIGQNMDHYVIEGRKFQQAFNSISGPIKPQITVYQYHKYEDAGHGGR